MPITFDGIRDIPLADLVQLPGNPRRGNVAELRKSVRRLGQYRTIVVRDTGSDLIILAGNHTARALAAEGQETARCEVIRCDDTEARRVALSDNRLSDIAADDTDALLEMLSGLDGDLDGTGWTEEDVSRLTGPGDLPDPGDADTDTPAEHWGVIAECDSEAEQVRLLDELGTAGWRVRALIT